MARRSKIENRKTRKYGGVLTEIKKGELYAIDVTVEGQRIRERFRGNKTEATQRMEALRASAKTGVQVNKRSIVYSDYSNQYLTDLEQSGRVRPSTSKQYRTIESHIKNSCLGRKKLVSISSSDINSMLVELRSSGIGETTLYQIYAQVKRIFNAAIDDRIIQFNPVNKNVHTPVLPKPDRHALSRDEAARLLNVLLKSKPNACTLAVLIALSTGLRIGEILGLTVGNTKIGCKEPHFNVIQQRTKEGRITARKTAKNGQVPNSWIPIDDKLEQVLTAWLSFQSKYFEIQLCMEVTEDTPLCSNAAGGWSDTHNIEKQFRRLCVDNGFGGWVDDEGNPIIKVGIGEDISTLPENAIIEYYDSEGWPVDKWGKRYSRTYPRPKMTKHYKGLKLHELRKTCFTLRLDRGESIKTLQAHGGWFSPRMLLENYGESVDESVKATPDFLGYLQSA